MENVKYDAVVSWSKRKDGGKVYQVYYRLGESTKADARAMALEIHDIDEAPVYHRGVYIVRAKGN